MVKREIFSLLAFEVQSVMNEIGFVSHFRPFLPDGSSQPNRSGPGGGRAEVLHSSHGGGKAASQPPQSKTQATLLEYDFLIVIWAYYHGRRRNRKVVTTAIFLDRKSAERAHGIRGKCVFFTRINEHFMEIFCNCNVRVGSLGFRQFPTGSNVTSTIFYGN